MKIKSVLKIFIIGFIAAITFHFIALAATDAPHNASNNIDCGSCHGAGLLNSPFWGGTMSYDQLCLNCHKASSGPYSETYAPLVMTHSSLTTSDKYGDWERECRNCHNPHYQRQKLYKNTDANNLYLATGTITSCSYNDGSKESTLTYSTITYKTGWDYTKLTEKTSGYRRTILFPNVNKLGYNYPIKAVDTPTANTITVTGNSCTYLYPPTTFAAIYGQYIKDVIDVNGTNKQVKFFDQTGTNSYADGDGTYNGVCEVCHTQTEHFRNNGEAPDQNHANIGEDEGTNCIFCHNHIDGLSHFASEGMGCDACHGKDSDNGGAGTTASHSTHMENDADDLKGPHTDCFDCHDIDNFPKFADGADTLAATTVCDNCHSPGGGYNGVAMAKANWDTGIYESDGVTLKSGKDLWCATCHDDVPALSSTQRYEVVMDNTDAVFEGAWTTGSNTDQYGDSVQWNLIADPLLDSTATWRPDIPFTCQYSVYAWWTVHPNRVTDAPYTIHYNGGSVTVDVNQEINGGKWNYLGTYPFTKGTDGYVVLSDDSPETGQYVIADAVKFVSGPPGVNAPKVIGDNTTYGYYATGHGAHGLVQCLDCHDASKTHIDHDARTYDAGVTPYSDSYRLKEVGGLPAMTIPRSMGGGLANWQDFALCFSCHDRYAVIGATAFDVSHTNFYDEGDLNSHWRHLEMDDIFDSDFDGTIDSAPSCVTCHNVHGSPTGPMIRHGELISPPGTTSYVPSLNFSYLLPGDGSATATFTATGLSGTYDVYAWWSAHPNRATNAKYIINHDGGSAEVIKDQEQNGAQWNLLGRYDFDGTDDYVVLTSDGANENIMADAIGWDSDLDGTPDIIIDDPDATYQGTWPELTTNPDQYGASERYYYAPVWDVSASVTESIGARMISGRQIKDNHTCGTCHDSVAWYRSPYSGPRIYSAKAAPDRVSNEESTPVLFTATVNDLDDNVTSVVVDLYSVGGSIDQPMYDDGTNGDVTADDGTYSYQHSIPAGNMDAPYELSVVATDADTKTGTASIDFTVYNPDALIVDNPDASFVGSWTIGSTQVGVYSYDTRWHEAGTGVNIATWTVSVPSAGNYSVYAWWSAHSNRATDAPYTINHAGGSAVVDVCQEVTGGRWNYLGNYNFAVGDYDVVLSDDADEYVMADAIKFEHGDGPAYPWPISDNVDARYEGSWRILAPNVEQYGRDAYYNTDGEGGGDGNSTATWTLAVPEAGNYNVYARWVASSNRATDAPYTINHEGGPTTVDVNQEVNGGQWNLLGTFYFNAGNYSVTLSGDANQYVIADAVKMELQP
jgi:hypothetical protein